MKFTRVLSAASITAALLGGGVFSAAPASAYVGADVDASLTIGPNGTSSRALPTITQGVANGDGTRGVAFTCSGLSTGDAASTGVSCTLSVNGTVVQRAQTVYLPGPATTTGGVRISVPSGASVKVCAFVVSNFIVSPQLTSGGCATTIVSPSV